MQNHHITAHELDLLDVFVHDCVHQLPKLPSASAHQLPPRCSTYHTSCSTMMKQVLKVVEPLSPRVCHLLAQIWDLTSLNFFVLIKSAQTSLEERDALHVKWKRVEKFHDEAVDLHAQRSAKYEMDIATNRKEASELRAELKTIRQKANRQGVENAQLRKAVHRLMEASDHLHATEEMISHDVKGIGAAEEMELFGVKSEELESVEKVHPLESYAQDFDQLFQGLVEKEREQVNILNEMDRFMNSSVVTLLWRHGPKESQTKLLERMLNTKTIGVQTNESELCLVQEKNNTDEELLYEIGGLEESIAMSGETGNATMVTKRQVIPASLRAQITTRPKIERVLEMDHLSRVILRLLLEKMDSDGEQLRQHKPRVPLHRFIKEFYMVRYGLESLADYHMLEIVKSCLYYHEKQEVENRKQRLLTGSPSSVSSSSSTLNFNLIVDQDLTSYSIDSARIALFNCIAELVPITWRTSQPTGGNLFASVTNAVLDMLGDMVELDASLKSVNDLVERITTSNEWNIPRERAVLLLSHHLSFMNRAHVDDILVQFRNVFEVSSLPVDALLVVYATHWLNHDFNLTTKLHTGFHRMAQITTYSSMNSSTSQPLDMFRHIWTSMANEHLSAHDLADLEAAFGAILEVRKPIKQNTQRRSSIRRESVSSIAISSLGHQLGGITEKEFVFHTQQVIRPHRTCRGLRTNGRCVVDSQTMIHYGGFGIVLSDPTSLSLNDLKPGLEYLT